MIKQRPEHVTAASVAKEVGVSLRTIHRWECGRCEPTIKEWISYALACEVDPLEAISDELLSTSDEGREFIHGEPCSWSSQKTTAIFAHKDMKDVSVGDVICTRKMRHYVYHIDDDWALSIRVDRKLQTNFINRHFTQRGRVCVEVGYKVAFKNGSPALEDQFLLQLKEKELLVERWKSEKELEDSVVVPWLESIGAKYVRQDSAVVHIGSGKKTAVCDFNVVSHRMIVECKNDMKTPHELGKALGQARFYALAFRYSRVMIVSADGVSLYDVGIDSDRLLHSMSLSEWRQGASVSCFHLKNLIDE
jgi:DNA-binding XRE family transcriptional regulator